MSNPESKKQPTLQEKIILLSKIHARSHPDALAYVRQWRDRFAQLQVQQDWLDHPNTRELRELAVEHVDRIVSILANNPKLSNEERAQFFAEKDAHIVYLAVLTGDPGSEMKTIESAVDGELTP